ncbi:glutamyl-tRNA(Gln) amidotransferase subunit C [Spiroplasma helicoides]|uniref:Glutamyl-tRNA(Gln) amidotransferase subunit C n=1 Tax=Spiroplasma helicoides TaxID=216938 RepID=A0A1B3SJG7_9MOLU|nr:Asp-tRNA(Asn)/Glu-tRNA(Gln) amidotransferase subunit GatC [Spiroplasma helicoides]AOG60075.1 glutamyl-tRNA(Gln) amidotransferase subunit C [Spiroplasma helicoides]
MKIDKKLIKELADDIMLEISDEEADAFLKTEKELLAKFEKVLVINVDNVEPSFYCFDHLNNFLRDDNKKEVISKQELLNNAPKSKDGYVIIEKVVK